MSEEDKYTIRYYFERRIMQSIYKEPGTVGWKLLRPWLDGKLKELHLLRRDKQYKYEMYQREKVKGYIRDTDLEGEERTKRR